MFISASKEGGVWSRFRRKLKLWSSELILLSRTERYIQNVHLYLSLVRLSVLNLSESANQNCRSVIIYKELYFIQQKWKVLSVQQKCHLLCKEPSFTLCTLWERSSSLLQEEYILSKDVEVLQFMYVVLILWSKGATSFLQRCDTPYSKSAFRNVKCSAIQ